MTLLLFFISSWLSAAIVEGARTQVVGTKLTFRRPTPDNILLIFVGSDDGVDIKDLAQFNHGKICLDMNIMSCMLNPDIQAQIV
jgi:hypothetical protein